MDERHGKRAETSPTTTVRLGNLFDGPSDMVVLPCSTAGTVTGFVARSLAAYSLPHPRVGMRLGEVEVMPFHGGENIAQYVAFAASVHGYGSSADAIERIGSTVGEFTFKESSVRRVAAPLLGAGAGGLQAQRVIGALTNGFQRTGHPASNLIVHVLDRDVFNRLRGDRRGSSQKPRHSPRVFISHTSANSEASKWVEELALFLIDEGIQARLDRFHLRHGMDLPQWMTNELTLADKVIVVCDETYKLKADGRLGGVGWETMIIQGDVLNQQPESTKYQVIVRCEDLQKGLPNYLKTRYVFHAAPSDSANTFRSELVRELLDLPLYDVERTEFTL